MSVRVQAEDFNVSAEIDKLRLGKPAVGAVAVFVGTVRDVNEGDAVSNLVLEHYPGMTEKSLEAIVEEAKGRWNVLEVTVIHRVGEMKPTDQIVLVAVSGAHRGEAFAACEFIMDYLKTRAPFWKKEKTSSGERWVEARDSDEAAAGRWNSAKT
jgi:molybdopterin synthase catalytic subunit